MQGAALTTRAHFCGLGPHLATQGNPGKIFHWNSDSKASRLGCGSEGRGAERGLSGKTLHRNHPFRLPHSFAKASGRSEGSEVKAAAQTGCSVGRGLARAGPGVGASPTPLQLSALPFPEVGQGKSHKAYDLKRGREAGRLRVGRPLSRPGLAVKCQPLSMSGPDNYLEWTAPHQFFKK